MTLISLCHFLLSNRLVCSFLPTNWRFPTDKLPIPCLGILDSQAGNYCSKVTKWQSRWQRFISLSLYNQLNISRIYAKVTKWHYFCKNLLRTRTTSASVGIYGTGAAGGEQPDGTIQRGAHDLPENRQFPQPSGIQVPKQAHHRRHPLLGQAANVATTQQEGSSVLLV